MSPEPILSPTGAIAPSLEALAAEDPSVVVLDLSTDGKDLAPGPDGGLRGRCVKAEKGERDAVMLAAGLSLAGWNVFVFAPSPLLVPRAYEAIRSAVAVPCLPVKFLLANSGLSGNPAGAATQMVEDIAFLRALPNVSIIVPSDASSASKLIENSGKARNPAFFRLHSLKLPSLERTSDTDRQLSGASLLRAGDGVTVCACGTMVHEALRASAILAQQGIEAEVIDCFFAKPLPAQVITASVRRTGCCVVAEEHSVSGGLGGAIAELLCQSSPVPIKFVSVQDRFGQSGGAEELLEYYGLSFKEILSAASQAWTMRRR